MCVVINVKELYKFLHIIAPWKCLLFFFFLGGGGSTKFHTLYVSIKDDEKDVYALIHIFKYNFVLYSGWFIILQ